MYKLYKKSKKSQARLGLIKTKHGEIRTPVFMPVATQGVIKTLISEDLDKLSADILLANTYHLFLRPGIKILKQSKGLHNFMNWDKPILTDSGGYQIFSLAGNKQQKNNLVKIEKNKVIFKSHLDGSSQFLSPVKALQIQNIIGSDIQMVLDVCTANPATYEQAKADVKITLAWAKKAKQWLDKNHSHLKKPLVFGIVQGSVFSDLRKYCAKELVNLNFSGYAIGGLAVGETAKQMYQVLDEVVPYLPNNKPRYLMGVGKPTNILEAVIRGVDMFDCVIPTREARHGRLYIWRHKNLKRKDFYTTINIENKKYSRDLALLNPTTKTRELKSVSKAYLHHLFRSGEPTALRLATLNNLEFYLQLMIEIRKHIFLSKI